MGSAVAQPAAKPCLIAPAAQPARVRNYCVGCPPLTAGRNQHWQQQQHLDAKRYSSVTVLILRAAAAALPWRRAPVQRRAGRSQVRSTAASSLPSTTTGAARGPPLDSTVSTAVHVSLLRSGVSFKIKLRIDFTKRRVIQCKPI
eukprot:COSAG03_NODE_464_length_7697_cov_3.596999_5_plen_144_part_00